jgi:hypothetical protein
MSTIPVAAPRLLTYARARLFLGTTAVGTVVVLSALALALELPARWLPTEPGVWPVDAAWIALAVALHAAVLAPFDLFAGLLVPREYGRTSEPLGRFLWRWWRGACGPRRRARRRRHRAHAGRPRGRRLGAMAAFLGLSAALLAWQPWVAAGVGGLRLRRAQGPLRDLGARTLVADAHHPHFTGGAFGLPFRTAWLFPERWRRRTGARRARPAGRAAARDRALGRARPWRPAGGRLERVAAAAGARRLGRAGRGRRRGAGSRWSAPWVVRRRPAAADAVALGRAPGRPRRGRGRRRPARLAAALEELDLDGDGEPDRPEVVEAVFHPIPALRSRRAVLAGGVDPGPRVGPVWHAARVALYTSWAGMGFLGRAVHCNLGRPEVWVFLPSD